jgi:hypothetical protein
VSPPCIVVEAYEDDRVIFEPFALMDSHQRDLIDALECIEAGHPVGCAFGGREEMDAEGFEDDLEEVSYAIFGIGSGDGSQVEIFKNPSGEVHMFDPSEQWAVWQNPLILRRLLVLLHDPTLFEVTCKRLISTQLSSPSFGSIGTDGSRRSSTGRSRSAAAAAWSVGSAPLTSAASNRACDFDWKWPKRADRSVFEALMALDGASFALNAEQREIEMLRA